MGGAFSSTVQETRKEIRNKVVNEFVNKQETTCSAKMGSISIVAEKGARVSGVDFNQICTVSASSIIDAMISQIVDQEVTEEMINQGGGFFSSNVQRGTIIQEQDIRNYIENISSVEASGEIGDIELRASGESENGTPSIIEDIDITQDLTADSRVVVEALADTILSQRGLYKTAQEGGGGGNAIWMIIIIISAIILLGLIWYFMNNPAIKITLTVLVLAVGVGLIVYFLTSQEEFMSVHPSKHLKPYGVEQDRDNANKVTDDINDNLQTYLFFDSYLHPSSSKNKKSKRISNKNF